jgi:hypothetical protein
MAPLEGSVSRVKKWIEIEIVMPLYSSDVEEAA